MKVAVVYTSPYPKKTGASGADRRIRDYVRGLKSAGADVTMFIPQYQRASSYEDAPEDFQIRYIGNKLGAKVKVLNRFLFWTSLIKLCEKEGYTHLFLYNTTYESAYFAKRARKRGLKVIVEICDLHSGVTGNWSLKEHLAIKNDENLPKEADLVVTISDFLKDRIEGFAPHVPIVKYPIFVDSDLFDSEEILKNKLPSKEGLGLSEDDFLIAYVGGLWHHEGVKYLVESFNKIQLEFPNAKLLIAGKYTKSPLHDDVEGMVEELGIKDKVILPGWVDTNTVKKIFSAADLLVVSQTDHDFSKAGLPTKLAEYSASGKAILVTKVGDVPYYFEDGVNSVMCEPSDSNSMKNAIQRVITDVSLKEQIAKNSRKLAETKFDYRVNGERLKKELKTL